VFLVLLLCQNFAAKGGTSPGLRILAIDTSFGRVASGSGDFVEQFERERQIFGFLRGLGRSGEIDSADIIILPETLIGRMNPTTKKRWERFFARWTKDGKTFLVGAEIPDEQGEKYDNVMIAFDDGGERQNR
jgi:apolipoprotein N-acyltransferase